MHRLVGGAEYPPTPITTRVTRQTLHDNHPSLLITVYIDNVRTRIVPNDNGTKMPTKRKEHKNDKVDNDDNNNNNAGWACLPEHNTLGTTCLESGHLSSSLPSSPSSHHHRCSIFVAQAPSQAPTPTTNNSNKHHQKPPRVHNLIGCWSDSEILLSVLRGVSNALCLLLPPPTSIFYFHP